MSVMNPGGEEQRAAQDDHRPVVYLLAGNPALAQGAVEVSHAARLCDRASAAPTRLSTTRSVRVGRTPIAPPIWMIA